MREVDDTWPEIGSRLHHSVGSWPMLVDDHTEVLEAHPPHEMTLRARAWPLGEAFVRLTLEPAASGTEVTIEEDVTSGPGRVTPPPLRSALLSWRNRESLERLSFLAERRA